MSIEEIKKDTLSLLAGGYPSKKTDENEKRVIHANHLIKMATGSEPCACCSWCGRKKAWTSLENMATVNGWQ